MMANFAGHIRRFIYFIYLITNFEKLHLSKLVYFRIKHFLHTVSHFLQKSRLFPLQNLQRGSTIHSLLLRVLLLSFSVDVTHPEHLTVSRWNKIKKCIRLA
jgi:hypothetical protein